MKKVLSIALAFVMVLSLSVVAFAAAGDGEIIITNAKAGQTYTLYKIFDLAAGYIEDNPETADDEGRYTYTVSSKWAEFVKQAAIKDVYVSVDDFGYVTWVENASAADFAELALSFAKANNIEAEASVLAVEGETCKATGLVLGYYLIDTTMGTLCALNTTDHPQEVVEKNEDNTSKKEVQEDSTSAWGEENTADIGQVVNFKATIDVKKGTANLVYHDTMSDGLTPVDSDADSVIDVAVTLNDVAVAQANYTVKTGAAEGACKDHTFCIAFEQAFLNTITADGKIEITYSATVNENAVVEEAETNSEYISYGENGDITSTPVETKTYTYGVNVLKVDAKDNTPLAGAKFVIYKQVGDNKEYAVINGGKLVSWTNTQDDATELVSGADGKIAVAGLDADTYYLLETQAPTNYNNLKDPVMFIIEEDGDVTDEVGGTPLENKTIKVENNSGSLLPTTGGMGVTIFYVLGAILMLGAVVVLVTKRRMCQN